MTWLLLTLAFGFYVTSITDYDATYGSLGAVIALLPWLAGMIAVIRSRAGR